MIANLARQHRVGEPIPRIAYTPQEVEVWGHVLRELGQLFPRHACSGFLRALPLLGFREDEVRGAPTLRTRCLPVLAGLLLLAARPHRGRLFLPADLRAGASAPGHVGHPHAGHRLEHPPRGEQRHPPSAPCLTRPQPHAPPRFPRSTEPGARHAPAMRRRVCCTRASSWRAWRTAPSTPRSTCATTASPATRQSQTSATSSLVRAGQACQRPNTFSDQAVPRRTRGRVRAQPQGTCPCWWTPPTPT